MKKYIAEAKNKAQDGEKYAVDGCVIGRYINGRLFLLFHNLHDCIHKSVAYYDCCNHCFTDKLR